MAKIVEILVTGHTLQGSVRVVGERVKVPDSYTVAPKRDQVRRWGVVKVREVVEETSSPTETEESPHEDVETSRPWGDLSASELGDLAAGFSDEELVRFRVWAQEAAAEGNEAAVTILDAIGG